MDERVRAGADGIVRCAWAYAGAAMVTYHDQEWGVPIAEDETLFGKLVLDTFQAGLSWRVILEKRAAFLEAFDGFSPERMARYDADRVEALMANPGIVRNRAKIQAAITNARAFLDIQATTSGFRSWLMGFVNHTPIIDGTSPTTSPEARAMARGLKAAGFRFTGPVVCYAFMQATGFVMDHAPGCHRADVCTRMLRATGGGRRDPP